MCTVRYPHMAPFHHTRPRPSCCLATPSTILHYTRNAFNPSPDEPPTFLTSITQLHFTDPCSLTAPWFGHELWSTAAVRTANECLKPGKAPQIILGHNMRSASACVCVRLIPGGDTVTEIWALAQKKDSLRERNSWLPASLPTYRWVLMTEDLLWLR